MLSNIVLNELWDFWMKICLEHLIVLTDAEENIQNICGFTYHLKLGNSGKILPAWLEESQ